MRVFFCLFLFLCISCSKTNSDINDSCVSVRFDESKFYSTQNYGIGLVELSLDANCLKVKLGISGCDDLHNIDMVSDGVLATSDPASLIFDFYDNNPQLCEAYFVVDREYDMAPILNTYNEDILVMFRNNSGSILIKN